MLITRRMTLALGAAAAASAVFKPYVARAAAPFEQPPLPYAEDALAPQISARTVGLHYGKHHKGYFDKLNTLAKGTPYAELSLDKVISEAKAKGDQQIFNNAGQAWNHNFYWQQFKGGPAAQEGEFAQIVEQEFGGLDALKDKMVEASEKVFGTGWVWLASENGKPTILGLQDAGNPVAEGKTALLGIDVWEHAYYLDYENRRAEHVRAVLDSLVNWQFVGQQMRA
jgi:Fe-Mn family superoxide dismutase